jgi:uncharacterized repeat protein (TIGR03809 family)
MMSERQPRPYDDVARKWHALAERRWAHFVELRDSGRWRRYYTWEQILEVVREAVDTRDTWARLAGLPESETPSPTGGAARCETANEWLDAALFRKAG